MSIDLVLDARSDERVRAEWEELAALGLSSLAAHRDASNRPHLTVATGVDDAELRAFDGSALSLPCTVALGAPILFGAGARRTLARSVVPTAALLTLRDAVHSQLPSARYDAPDAGEPGEWENGASADQWMPHVTLARRLLLSSIESAVVVVGGLIEGQLIGVRSWNTATRTVSVVAGSVE